MFVPALKSIFSEEIKVIEDRALRKRYTAEEKKYERSTLQKTGYASWSKGESIVVHAQQAAEQRKSTNVASAVGGLNTDAAGDLNKGVATGEGDAKRKSTNVASAVGGLNTGAAGDLNKGVVTGEDDANNSETTGEQAEENLHRAFGDLLDSLTKGMVTDGVLSKDSDDVAQEKAEEKNAQSSFGDLSDNLSKGVVTDEGVSSKGNDDVAQERKIRVASALAEILGDSKKDVCGVSEAVDSSKDDSDIVARSSSQ